MALVLNTTPQVGTGTFSAGNTSFTATSTTAVVNCTTAISGKKAFGAVVNSLSGNSAIIGVGGIPATGTTGFNGNNDIGWFNGGQLFLNGVQVGGTPPAYIQGFTVGVVVDATAKLMWVTTDGTNYCGAVASLSAAQVAAGTSGQSLSALPATLFPLLGNSSVVAQWTIQDFSFTLPSGFTQLSAGGAPAGATQLFPNPAMRGGSVSLATWTDPLKLNLRSKDTFFNGPGKGPTYDWPNPRGPTPAISLKTWVDPLKLTLQGKDAFFGGAGRPPVFDYPNPRDRIPAIVLRTWIDRLKDNNNFFGLGGSPKFDWPNPGGPLYPSYLRTFINQSDLQHINQGGPPPNGTPDQQFPNPRGPVGAVQLRTWIDFYNTDLNTVVMPFIWDDWPNPSGITRRATPWIDPYPLTLNFVVAPFLQNDWPVPTKPRYPSDLWTFLNPLDLQLAGQDTFFGLAGHPTADWPVPPGSRPATSLKTWTDALKLELAGQDKFFGLAGHPTVDWPNPAVRRLNTGALSWADPYKFTLNVLVFPFGQSVWPVPMRSMPAASLKTWIEPLKLELAGKDRFFGLAGNIMTDWPLPKGYAPGNQPRTWINIQGNGGSPVTVGLLEYIYFARRRLRR